MGPAPSHPFSTVHTLNVLTDRKQPREQAAATKTRELFQGTKQAQIGYPATIRILSSLVFTIKSTCLLDGGARGWTLKNYFIKEDNIGYRIQTDIFSNSHMIVKCWSMFFFITFLSEAKICALGKRNFQVPVSNIIKSVCKCHNLGVSENNITYEHI